MNRVSLINALIQQKKFNNYLEIGVFNGHAFFRIKANFKVAVDPKFQFGPSRKFVKTLLNTKNLNNKYYEKKSDDFFADDAPALLKNKKIDIALVDGMHYYDFALRDVENTLQYLDDNGIIVMHDCNPERKEYAGTYEEWKQNNYERWNGDVWKSIVHLRSMRPDLYVCTLDCDFGLGIVTKGKPENILPFTQQQIEAFTYEDLDANRKEWLNLKPASFAGDLFKITL